MHADFSMDHKVSNHTLNFIVLMVGTNIKMTNGKHNKQTLFQLSAKLIAHYCNTKTNISMRNTADQVQHSYQL